MREASSSSDSEGSDFEEVDVTEEDSARIMELEGKLQDNPYQYDAHVQVGCGGADAGRPASALRAACLLRGWPGAWPAGQLSV